MSEFPKIDIATQFHRNNAIPLDSTEKFDSLPAATDYAEKNGTAYIGQIITVVEKNSISAFQITSEKKLDLILTETNTVNIFEEISTDFEKIENLITDLSNETSADIYTINNKITELSGIVNKNIDFIKTISDDLSDDISNIVNFNKEISILNTSLDELSNLHKNDIEELLSSLEETNNNISDLSGKHKEDKEDISTKITEINGKIDYIYSDLSNKIDENTTLIDELSTALNDLSDVFSINNIELKEKITNLSEEHKKDIDELSFSLKETDGYLSGKIESLYDFMKIISDDLSDDISNIVEFNNKISELSSSLDDLSGKHKEDIGDLLSRLEITNESISDLSVDLKDDIEDISKKIDYIYSDLSDDISNIIDLNAKISKLNSNIDNLSSEHNTEISELKLSIDNLSTTTTKNINANTESILKLSDNISATKNELLNEINGNTLLIDELSGALDDLSDVFSEQNIDLEEKITNLSDKHKDDIDKLLVEIKETSDDLSGKIESLYDFMKIISDDLSDDISNIVEFNNKISNLSNNLDKLSGKHNLEIETLEKYITELSGEADNIESQVINLSTDFISEIAWRSKPTIIIGKDIDPTLSSDNRNSIMIGNKAAAPAGETIAIGSSAKATGYCTIAIGKDANRNIDNKAPENAIAIGHSSRAKNDGAIAIGNIAQTGTSNSTNAIAIGTSTISRGSGSIVIGKDAEIITTSNNSVAIGVSAMISGNNVSDAVQLGTGINTNHGTLQFRNYLLVDNNGKIFEERIPDQISANINKLSNSVNELSTSTFEAISKNTELINNLSNEIELSINELNKEIDDISSQHKNDFENLLSKTEDLNNEIDSISSEFSYEISDINSSIINIFDELISNTNNINELSDSVSSLNIYIDELSDKFETFENELSNKVPEYETDPVFTKWKDECSSVIIGKDAKIDDSTNGIALGLSASSNQNSIAIGMNAKASGPNRIVIGMNSLSEYKGIALGIGAASSGENSIAIGSDAKVYRNPSTDNEAGKGSIALGISAFVDGAKNAVQLGEGTNTSPSSLQFLNWPVINSDGQIHSNRLSTFSDEIIKKYAETMNYTAFEVLTLDEEISAGSKIKSIYNDSGEFSEYNVYNTIPAGYIHTTVLWSYKVSDVSGFNLMIDWGDGVVEMLDDIKSLNTLSTTVDTIEDMFKKVFPNTNNNTGSLKEMHPNISDFNWNGVANVAQAIFISHKYETAGKFIIKIYGTDYFGIAHGTKWNIPSSEVFSYNRVRLSRCFDYDLPIAPHVTSLNCFTGSSNPCLFEVNVPMYYNWVNAKDMAGLFKEKNNLQYVGSRALSNIFADSFTNIDIKGIFYKTPNLKYTNIRLPNYSTDLVHNGNKQSLYDYYNWSSCKDNLSIDVLNILPMDKFVDKSVVVGELFKGFSKISCSNYDKLASHLWNDKTVKWENTENCFTSCSLDLTKIPTTWGGLMPWDDRSDFEIISDMIDAEISNISDLSTNITDIYTKLDNTTNTITNISNNLSTTQANVTNISNMLSDIQNNTISNINDVSAYANSISAYADSISNLIDTRLDKMPEITEPTLKELNIPKYVEAGLSQSIPYIVDITQPKFEFGPDINITSVHYIVDAFYISKSYNYNEFGKVTTTLPLYKYLDLPALSVGEIIEFCFNADEIYVTDTSADFISGAYSKLGYKTVYGINNPSVSFKNYHLIAKAPYYYGTTNNADISSYSKDLLSTFTKNMVSGFDKFNITASKYDTNIIIVVPDDYIENVINIQNIYNIEKLQIDPVIINGIKYAFYNIDISTINNSVYCELMLENRISAIFEYDNTYTITGLTPFGKSLSYLEIPKYIDGNAISIVSSLNGTFATDIIIGDHILSVGDNPICGGDGGYNLNNIYISKNITQLNGIGSDNIKNLDLSHTQISSLRVDGKSLSNIIFPESLVEIQKNSFTNNSALTHLTIPKNVKNFIVGNNSFAFRSAHLTAINFYIDGYLEYIGERAFHSLEYLSSINIPSTVLSIGKNAFYLDDYTDVEFNVLTAINIYQDRETSPLVSQISTWNIVDESIVKFNGEF